LFPGCGSIANRKDDEIWLLVMALARNCFEDHVPGMLEVIGLVGYCLP